MTDVLGASEEGIEAAQEELAVQAHLRATITDRDRELAELKRQCSDLRHYVENNLPHRRSLNTALLFVMFFSGALLVRSVSGLMIISPLLGWLGLAFAGITAFFSLLARLEWRNWKSKDELGNP